MTQTTRSTQAYLSALERYTSVLEAIGRTLERRNSALRTALEWYADPAHYDRAGIIGTVDDSTNVRRADRGAVARAALEEPL